MRLTVDQHLDFIKSRLAQGQSYRQIAEQMGCSKDTLSIFVKVNLPELRRAATQSIRNDPLPEEPSETELLRAELKDIRASARKHRNVDVQAERQLQQLREAVVPMEPVYEAPEVAVGEGKRHAHILLLSDLHAGEIVNKEAMDGLGEYDWDIMHSRMQKVHKGLRSFSNNRPYPLEELHIWLLGDLNSGANHEEIARTNQYNEADQCYRTGELLAEFVQELIPDYPRIILRGVAGNHPRLSKKPASKEVFNNFDWLSMKFLEVRLSSYDTVDCDFPRSGYQVAQVAGKNVLLWHGDGIQSNMPGVPWGGVMRRVNEFRKEYMRKGVWLDGFACGHYHQLNWVQRTIFMNGSIKGIDEHTFKRYGSTDPWGQLLITACLDKQKFTDWAIIDED